MIRVCLILACLLACAQPALGYVGDDGWELAYEKKKSNLVVYTKVVEGQPIKAVKAVTTLDVPMQDLMMVLSDPNLVPEWIPVIGSAVRLRETDPDGVSVVYMVTKFPWPIKNRDAVVQTVTAYEPDSGTVTMESTGIADLVDEKKGLIRTPATYTRWEISPRADGTLRVAIITHSDPGGWFPNWLANMIYKRTPKSMFAGLYEALEREAERDRPFDDILVFGRPVGM